MAQLFTKPHSTIQGTTQDPDLADRFNRILGETVEALETTSIRYAFIGGIASGGLGRPRSTRDIDLFVRPEDAELVLRALDRHGFRTEKTDPTWLYKGFKEGILVDVIFRSKGDIYLDNEMIQRSITAEFHGKQLRLVAPEDLLIIKAAAHSELTPNHWHDATALLSHAKLDWAYLIQRARRAPRRVLSLLLYAQSIDIGVPNHVIYDLFQSIFEQGSQGGSRNFWTPRAVAAPVTPPVRGHQKPPTIYDISHLREWLAEDSRTNELDIRIEQEGETLLLRGEVTATQRRDAVEQIARERFPFLKIENQIRVLEMKDPSEVESVK